MQRNEVKASVVSAKSAMRFLCIIKIVNSCSHPMTVIEMRDVFTSGENVCAHQGDKLDGNKLTLYIAEFDEQRIKYKKEMTPLTW